MKTFHNFYHLHGRFWRYLAHQGQLCKVSDKAEDVVNIRFSLIINLINTELGHLHLVQCMYMRRKLCNTCLFWSILCIIQQDNYSTLMLWSLLSGGGVRLSWSGAANGTGSGVWLTNWKDSNQNSFLMMEVDLTSENG